MKNSYLKPSISILLVVLFFGTQTYAQNWDKMLVKINDAYETGDYIKSKKSLTKLKKKTSKKLGKENKYVAEFYLLSARNNLAKGLLSDFSADIDKALAMSEIVFTANSEEHIVYMNRASSLLILNGEILKAFRLATEAQAKTEELGASERLAALTKLNLSAVYSGMGFYTKSIDFIAENENYFLGRAITKESYVDPKTGKLKSKRLPQKEIDERLDEYAQLLNLRANTYRLMGDFKKADAEFELAGDWIDNNLGKTNLRYIENQLHHGDLLSENGTNEKVTRAYYETALSKLKKDHSEAHYLALQVYESLLKNYLANNDNSKFKNLKSEYERVIKKYFNKKSLVYIRLETVDFSKMLDKKKPAGIESSCLAMLADSKRIPAIHKQRIELYEYAYKAAILKNSYKNADSYLDKILELKVGLYGSDAPEYHLTNTEVANFYIDYTDKIKEAGEIYTNSFEKIVKPQIKSGHVQYVRIKNHLSKFYELDDNFDGAKASLDDALLATRIKYNTTDIAYGSELVMIADLQIKIGEYKEAEKNITTAKEILIVLKKDREQLVDYILALETNAKLSAMKGDFEQAKNEIIRSQKLLLKATNLTGYDDLASTVNLADIYVKYGRISRTRDALTEVIEDYESLFGTESNRLIIPLLSYGNLQLVNGEYTESEKSTRRALNISIAQFGENSSKTAFCKKQLAKIYTSLGDYNKALDNVNSSISIQKSVYGSDHIEVAKSLSQLALIKFYKNEPPNTIEPIFEESKKIIAEKIGNRTPMFADVIKDLSIIYIEQNRFDDAFNSLSLAENIWKTRVKDKKNLNLADIYSLTGDVYYQQKNYTKAEEKYNQAKKLYEGFFSDEHPDYVQVISKLSKVYYMQGDKRKAKKTSQEVIYNYSNFIKTYFASLSEREKSEYWNTIKTDYEFFNTIAIEFKDEDPKLIEQVYNNALSTKAILLNSSIKIRKTILNGDDEELKRNYLDWLAKKEFLTTVLSMSTDQLFENEIDPALLIDEVELLEKQLSEGSELFSNDSDKGKVAWQDVQGVLGSDEVAIEMIRFRYFDHIFTDSIIYMGVYVKNSKELKTPGMFVINNGKELEGRYFKVYRNSIIYRVKDRYSNEKYWKPIIDAVGNTSSIYLSADGVYNQINLEAIPTSDDKYVLDNSNIVLVSNTKDLFFNKTSTSKGKTTNSASMFGNPIYYVDASRPEKGAIGQLPGTEKEINALIKLLDKNGWTTSEKLEYEATESAIKQIKSPKIFHVATHGFFTPAQQISQNAASGQKEATALENPLLRTGLLLTGAGDLLTKTEFNYNEEDGILTAYEAMNMNLDNTDLVVLSACETGLGETKMGEGVYGLQRAFMVAGAKTLIMSMFKVDDTATQKLMVNFYQKWITTGNKRQSFVEAKKELRNEYKDPIYWGAFIMIGLE
ncbi:MAG: CHAT domain-containing protein [Cyclobacteriaceae bacterium]|nr:CHAT domain-containing protein [Cyclobacteriaceae bacterium]